MGVHPQRGLERLQRRRQIAGTHVDHAEAAQGSEMARFQIDDAGNVAARPLVVPAHEPDGGALVPGLGMCRVIANEFAEDTLGVAKLAQVHLANADGHQVGGARIIFERRPSLPYFSNDILRGIVAGDALELVEKVVQIRVALVGAGVAGGKQDKHCRPDEACKAMFPQTEFHLRYIGGEGAPAKGSGKPGTTALAICVRI